MSFITNLFLKCSGVNKRILGKVNPDYLETERTKFVGIGGAIFFTACLAFVSSSFALSTFVEDVRIGSFVIDKIVLCIGFGILWAIMIFNLDRYIVSSMRKTSSFMQELWHATPRIIIALLFAVVISKPLELEIFRTEIEAQLPKSANEQTKFLKNQMDSIEFRISYLKSKNDSLRINPYNSQFTQLAIQEYNSASSERDSLIKEWKPDLQKIENKLSNLNTKYYQVNQVYKKLYSEKKSLEDLIKNNPDDYFNYEKKARIEAIVKEREKLKDQLNRTYKSIKVQEAAQQKIQTRIDDKDENVKKKSNNLDAEKEDIGSIVKAEIKKNISTIEDLEAKYNALEQERNHLNKLFTGLLARLKALDDLKSAEGNLVIFLASTLIFLIFVAIETAPVIVKLLSKQTPYDQLLEEYEKPITNKGVISEKVNSFYDEDARLLEKEKEILRNFYKKKLKIQKNYLTKSLEYMQQQEEAKFENNKDEFTSYLRDNPKEYLDSFKSRDSPMTEKGGKLLWESEEELSGGFLKEKILPYAPWIGGGLGVIILSFFIFNYFNKAGINSSKELSVNPNPPKPSNIVKNLESDSTNLISTSPLVLEDTVANISVPPEKSKEEPETNPHKKADENKNSQKTNKKINKNRKAPESKPKPVKQAVQVKQYVIPAKEVVKTVEDTSSSTISNISREEEKDTSFLAQREETQVVATLKDTSIQKIEPLASLPSISTLNNASIKSEQVDSINSNSQSSIDSVRASLKPSQVDTVSSASEVKQDSVKNN